MTKVEPVSPSSDSSAPCENPLRTGDRRRGSNMAGPRTGIPNSAYLELSSVPLPRNRGAQADLLVHVVVIIDATVVTAS